MSRSPRVLMVCYAFPPMVVSGTARSESFAAHLPSFGWMPTVLTVRNPKYRWAGRATTEPVFSGVEIVRAPELNLEAFVELLQGTTNRLMRLAGGDLRRHFYRRLLCTPDAQIAWMSVARGLPLARRHDVIYASCSPFSSALTGCALKWASGRPLVLDFRDGWALNPHERLGSTRARVIGALERVALACCDRLILNTDGTADLYGQAYPEWRHKMVVIPNGYDGLYPAPERTADEPFRIVHVGNFYANRTPELLLDAIETIGSAGIEFVQVGASHPTLERRRSVAVRVTGTVPRPVAIEMMRTASLLYLKQAFEPGLERDVAVAAKTYEYLSTGLPILIESPPGDNVDLVTRYGTSSHVVTTPDARLLAAAVLRARAKSKGSTGRIDDQFVARFDRRRLTQSLAGLLDEVAGRTRGAVA